MFLCLLLVACCAMSITSDLLPTEVISRPGHYPHIWCQFSNVILSAGQGAFLYVKNPDSDVVVDTECHPLTDIWPIKALGNDMEVPTCDEEYEEGHAFTIYYFLRGSNYFHLHTDTVIPLYQILHHNQDSPPDSVVLMPTVETTRLMAMNWDTDAFGNPSKYWMKIMRPLMKDNMILLPLERSFLNTSSNICFKSIYFGTPHVNLDNPVLMQGFVQFMKAQLHVLERPLTVDSLRVGLISRINRRRIVNEQELLEAVRPIAGIDLIRFETLSVREQISLVQRYAVIIGMNGAGLMNALYRPEHAVAIQLVPYKAELNYKQFGLILSTVGPYLEWHNTYPSLHHTQYSHPDTTVNVTEFRELVQTALGSVKDLLFGIKEEL